METRKQRTSMHEVLEHFISEIGYLGCVSRHRLGERRLAAEMESQAGRRVPQANLLDPEQVSAVLLQASLWPHKAHEPVPEAAEYYQDNFNSHVLGAEAVDFTASCTDTVPFHYLLPQLNVSCVPSASWPALH